MNIYFKKKKFHVPDLKIFLAGQCLLVLSNIVLAHIYQFIIIGLLNDPGSRFGINLDNKKFLNIGENKTS